MLLNKIKIIYYIVITLLASTVLLLSFVIPHGGYEINEPTLIDPIDITEPLDYSGTLPSVLNQALVVGSHESTTALITIYKIRAFESDVYVADVVVKQAEVIRSALAYNIFGGSNYVQTVSTMAEERDAIFAINSDYANHYDSGIVIRNGQVLRRSISYRYATALWEDGSVTSFKESSTSAEALHQNGAWQVWSFGPVLVKEGIAVSSVNDGLQRSAVDNPRSAFGWISDFHYMFVVVDGRSSVSKGVDIEELADIMLMLDCKEAYNFDGGGSATMYFDGSVVNVPSSGEERKVGDCVYIYR